jgi:hypothetical protein
MIISYLVIKFHSIDAEILKKILSLVGSGEQKPKESQNEAVPLRTSHFVVFFRRKKEYLALEYLKYLLKDSRLNLEFWIP